jgi:hypothetical protein
MRLQNPNRTLISGRKQRSNKEEVIDLGEEVFEFESGRLLHFA